MKHEGESVSWWVLLCVLCKRKLLWKVGGDRWIAKKLHWKKTPLLRDDEGPPVIDQEARSKNGIWRRVLGEFFRPFLAGFGRILI